MTIEDMFSGVTSSIVAFDMEVLLENHIRRTKPEEDLRVFKYEDSVLRPRHVVDLWEVCRPHRDRIFLATAPVVQLDGTVYEMKSVGFDSFVDLLKALDDIVMSQRHPILYSITRSFHIDPGTFDPVNRFIFRCPHF